MVPVLHQIFLELARPTRAEAAAGHLALLPEQVAQGVEVVAQALLEQPIQAAVAAGAQQAAQAL